MSTEKLIAKLHPYERAVISKIENGITLNELAEKSKLQLVEATRAVQWLSNKNLITIKEETEDIISLEENGELYKKNGLPEKRFLKAVDKKTPLSKIQKIANLEQGEINICIGTLRKKAAIEVEKSDELLFTITENGKKLLGKNSLEEEFLNKNFPLKFNDLSPEEKFAFDNLINRKKIIKKELEKIRIINLTKQGQDISKKADKAGTYEERLTQEMLKTGNWKNKQFREYDVSINVPKIFAGKRQAYSEFIESVREKVVNMGFIEMTGPIIELEFYNFDALFQPQNHPARNWSATYKIKDPKIGELKDTKAVKAIKAAHEDGGKTESRGWNYKWNEDIAKQLMPRAHDTAISPRMLSNPELQVPGKYFSLVRCYRPDVIDATHGVEFNQLGGFIVGEDLSFTDLLGLLKQFVQEMTGATEVRFLPDYFPFTEPSVQISVKHPEFGWMELAGAGMFRPEMTESLGVKQPVLAWGFGIDRLAMLKLGIKDIRDLFSQNLDYLRNAKKDL